MVRFLIQLLPVTVLATPLVNGCAGLAPKPAAANPVGPEPNFTLSQQPVETMRPLRPARSAVQVSVVHVQVPESALLSTRAIWNHLNENLFDVDTALRIRRNGLRVGVANERDWPAIQAVLEAAEGRLVNQLDPVRLPADYPLSLELDTEPHHQTLFYVGSDGILSGATWPDSRNALRLLYAPDPGSANNLRMELTPEVHQKQEGWRFSQTPEGLWPIPKEESQAFFAAGVSILIAQGQIIVLGPSESAGVRGMIGCAFLTRELKGKTYYSIIVIRPEFNDET